MNDDLRAMLERLSELSDEELAQLEEGLIAAAAEYADDDSDAATTALEEIAESVTHVRDEAGARITAATERRERREAALSAIGTTNDPDPEDPPAEDPPVTPDPEPAPTPDPDPDDPPPATPSGTVTAASTRRQPMPQAPAARAQIVVNEPRPSFALTASAEGGGGALREMSDLADLFSTRGNSARMADGLYPVVHAESHGWPAELDLRGLSAMEASKRIAAVMAPQALAAAGGTCEPITPRWDVETLGNENRPVLGANPTFRADRAGVQFVKSPILSEVTVADSVGAAVRKFTKEQDASGDDYPKNCQRIDCFDTDTAYVYAINKCLTVGNWQYTFFREQFTAFWDLVGVAYARRAEDLLLAAMEADSNVLPFTKVLGTARDLYDNIAIMNEVLHDAYREDAIRARVIMPAWLRQQAAVDFVRQAPGDQADEGALAKVDRMLGETGVNVTYSRDYQRYSLPATGVTPGWKKTVRILFYMEGTWFNLDGGEIDFGLVRDSVLNAANDLQVQSEGFEGIARFGLESYVLEMDICPDGTTSAPVDIAPCEGNFGS